MIDECSGAREQSMEIKTFGSMNVVLIRKICLRAGNVDLIWGILKCFLQLSQLLRKIARESSHDEEHLFKAVNVASLLNPDSLSNAKDAFSIRHR
jgi:hypothetical protein